MREQLRKRRGRLILALGLCLAACGGRDVRHAPEAHMDQNAERYRYDYDDGVCSYRYEYDFKTRHDRLEEGGDCRNVPIERYQPQAAIVPAYPPSGAAPPLASLGAGAPPQPAPTVDIGRPIAAPSPAAVPNAPSGITVAPLSPPQ
jgi:hypothetical protein